MLQQIDGKIDMIFANYIRNQKQYRRGRKTLPPPSLMPTEHIVSAVEGLPRFCIHDEPSNTSQQLLTRLANTSHINVFGFMHGSIITTTTGYSDSLEGDKDAELHSSTKSTFQVLFKLSFYTRGLRFQTNDSLNSWCLNSIRCISKDSPIFTLCQNGNAQGMLRLFRARKASIYDVDEQGWSLLHVRLISSLIDMHTNLFCSMHAGPRNQIYAVFLSILVLISTNLITLVGTTKA